MKAPVRVRVVGTFSGTTLEKVRARVQAYGAVLVSCVDAGTDVVALGRRYGVGCNVQKEFNTAAGLNARGADIAIVHTLDALWATLSRLRPVEASTPLLPRQAKVEGYALSF